MDAEDEDFTIIEERKQIDINSTNSGTVNYTKTNPVLVNMNINNKVEFAAFMSKYDVHQNREVAEMTPSRGFSLNKFKDPKFILDALKRRNKTLMLSAFVLFLVLVVLWGTNKTVVIIGENIIPFIDLDFNLIAPEKASHLFYAIVFIAMLCAIAFIMSWLTERSMKRFQILQYYMQ